MAKNKYPLTIGILLLVFVYLFFLFRSKAEKQNTFPYFPLSGESGLFHSRAPKLHRAALDPEGARWENTIRSRGVDGALNQALQESAKGSSPDCHIAAHRIGRVAYQIYQESAFGECDSRCNNGCYHGVMEGVVSHYGDTNLIPSLEKLCMSVEEKRRGECFHGAGHGILAYLSYDIPESLKKCGQLSSSYNREVCMTGVFMENINVASGLGLSEATHTTRWLNNDPHFPCNALDQSDEVQRGCYENQTDRMLQLFKSDFARVVAECLRAPKNAIATCFKSYGRDAAGYSRLDRARTMALCANAPQQGGYRDECIRGAVLQYIYSGTSSANEKAHSLCALVSPLFKQSCEKIVDGKK